MENVIQKYLRNQFSSLEEYNSQAGGASRIASWSWRISQSTSPSHQRDYEHRRQQRNSSVYTLVSVDMKLPILGFPTQGPGAFEPESELEEAVFSGRMPTSMIPAR